MPITPGARRLDVIGCSKTMRVGGSVTRPWRTPKGPGST
jgi:hypothetical protein